MKQLLNAFMLILMFMSAGKLTAQVSLDAEFRPRTEFRSGFRKPLADTLWPAFLTLQRTRFTADYKSKVLNTRLTIQDSRVWGKSDTKTSDSKIEIYEAWAEYLLTSGVSAQFGRQALKYDDQRLLGAANWSNTGLAHDALLLKFKPQKSLQVHLGGAYNSSKDTLLEVAYSTKQMYKTMGFLWVSKTFENGITFTAINILEGLQKTKDYRIVYPRNTTGANFTFLNDSSRFTVNAFLYLQKGKSSSFEDLNAYAFSAKAGYKIWGSFTTFAGTDYYSGTKTDTKAGTSHTFNKLYGANHSFNGYMEYFQAIPKAGLQDLFAGFTGVITKRLSAEITYHHFMLAQDFRVGTTPIDKYLGSEIDMLLNYSISKEIALQAGYCSYFNSGSTKQYFKVGGVDTHRSQWAYLMLTIKPNLYKTPVGPKN